MNDVTTTKPAALAAGATFDAALAIAKSGRILTGDGEIVDPSDAPTGLLAAWLADADALYELVRAMRAAAIDEARRRARLGGGQAAADGYTIGVGRETTPDLSGAASERVLTILLDAKLRGAISDDAVARVCPLVPHATPARVRDLASALDADGHADLAARLRGELPAPRPASVKVTRDA